PFDLHTVDVDAVGAGEIRDLGRRPRHGHFRVLPGDGLRAVALEAQLAIRIAADDELGALIAPIERRSLIGGYSQTEFHGLLISRRMNCGGYRYFPTFSTNRCSPSMNSAVASTATS